MTDQNLLKLVNASGYLFQLRVEHAIRGSYKQHQKEVLASEHRWESKGTGEHGFIDLVLRTGTNGKLVIECKRVSGEGQWVFLVPKTGHGNVDGFVSWVKILWSRLGTDERPLIAWDGFNIRMVSFASSFCIVRGQGEKEPSMLERLCGWLIKATESLAEEELQFKRGKGRSSLEIYFPAIITNARLMVCHYDPDEIDLVSGTIPEAEFIEVPFMRFTKSLPSQIPSSWFPQDLRGSAEQNERTVLVINSGRMLDVFSGEWEMGPPGYSGWPWDAERWTMPAS